MMASKELNLKMIATFPELNGPYHEYTDWQEGDETGSHVVFEHILARAIVFFLEGKQYGKAKIYLDFVESLLASGDEYAINVATVSVIEYIVYDELDEKDILPLLGPESLKTWRAYDAWKRK